MKMFKHVLLPTDGSPLSKKAVKAGIALAKEFGAKVMNRPDFSGGSGV
jgi:nucleotide-binding universal stress UspA family protein